MAMEYWLHHCHLVGYLPIAKSFPPSYYVSTTAENNDDNLASQATTNIYTYNSSARASVPWHPCSNGYNLQDPLHVGALTDQMDCDAYPSTSTNVGAMSHLPGNTPQQSQTELHKRRNPSSVIYWRAQKRQKNYASQPGSDDIVEGAEEQSRVIVGENTRLKAECSELQATEQQLIVKVEKLAKELEHRRSVCKSLTDELQSCDRNKALLHNRHHYHSSLGYDGSGL